MTLSKTLVSTCAALAFAGAAAVAVVGAQGRMAGPGMRGGGPPPMGRGGRGGGMPPLGAVLNLSSDQQARVDDILQNLHVQSAPLLDDARDAHAALHSAIFDDARDASKIATLEQKVSTIEAQLATLHETAMETLADLLTPEQRAIARNHPEIGGD